MDELGSSTWIVDAYHAGDVRIFSFLFPIKQSHNLIIQFARLLVQPALPLPS